MWPVKAAGRDKRFNPPPFPTETWIFSYNTVWTWILAWLLSASTVESSIRFNHNTFSVSDPNEQFQNTRSPLCLRIVHTATCDTTPWHTHTHGSVLEKSAASNLPLFYSGDGGYGFLQKSWHPYNPENSHVNMWILRPQQLNTSLDHYFEMPNISALLFMFGVNMHLQLDWLWGSPSLLTRGC